MDGMAMFLGLAPNRPLAQEFVKFGGMRVNGVVITDVNYSITVNDMLQIDLKINRHIRALHKNKH
jgi:ribosomal protein S4